MSFINIAIDGPSGAGKSTLAKAFAAKHGYIYVDTGALYRAIGLYASRAGIPVNDVSGIADRLSEIKLDIVFENGEQKVILNGENVNGLIRTPEISMYASAVSAVGKVREFLLDLQRDIAKNNNVVMDGRDIGTVILPNADVKIFLSATAEARAKRRLADLEAKGVNTTFEKVLSDMQIRDMNDSGRDIAPLSAATDSILLDNSGETLEESLSHIEKIAEERLGHAL